jgi:hypothetical protein
VINSIPSLINDKNDRKTVHKAIDARIQKATLTKGGANYVYLSAPPPKKTPKNITFAKKNHSKNMHAKSVRKLQNYIYN